MLAITDTTAVVTAIKHLIAMGARGELDRALPSSRGPPFATARPRVLAANEQRSLCAPHNRKPISQSLEPAPRHPGVMHRVAWISVAEVVLHVRRSVPLSAR